MSSKKIIKIVLYIALILLVSNIAFSNPPVPKNVAGRIFKGDGTGEENGVIVYVNNTNISQVFETEVYAPPIPQLKGSYSLVINGSTGDNINVWVYNSTHWGEENQTLSSSTTYANVIMNYSRPSETNISIIFPPNDTLVNSSEYFNLTVNISVVIANGIDCNVTLLVSNESIVTLAPGSNWTNNVGNIDIGESEEKIFELMGNKTGSVNISAVGICLSDGVNFEGLDWDKLSNITVEDNQPPVVKLINPENLTENKSTNEIEFSYNVTDSSTIDNCTLILNGLSDTTEFAINQGTTNTIIQNLTNGVYNWSVNCTDEDGFEGESGFFSLNISAYFPIITFLNPNQNITLTPASEKVFECNFTVEDGNGAADIVISNATFHSYSVATQGSLNNNTRYINDTCYNTASGGNLSNYTCKFSLQYYSSNGTWICNASVEDTQGLETKNISNHTIEPLYALNLSSTLIDYGNLASGQYSSDEVVDIVNFGNMPLNISLRGYGGDDPVLGDGYAMMCQNGENISVSNERYAYNFGTPYASKFTLSSSNVDFGLVIQKQTNPLVEVSNTSYWQLYLSPLQITECNGTIVFTAGGFT